MHVGLVMLIKIYVIFKLTIARQSRWTAEGSDSIAELLLVNHALDC